MMRGTFANIRIKNKITPEVEGGYTKHSENIMSIYDAAEAYQKDGTPLVIFAGKEYGTGSSRDWAAKGTYLLGVKAVIAESFERIHRSNLIGMGVIPLQLQETVDSLNLTGNETVEIIGLSSNISPKQKIQCKIRDRVFEVIARIDTEREIEYLKQGGIMQYVIGKNT
jgi:aconitate hydratase